MNPALGLLPLLLFAVLDIFTSYRIALLSSFLISLTALIIGLTRLVERKILNILYMVSVVVLGIFSFISLLPLDSYLDNYSSIFIQLIFLIFISLIFFRKHKIILLISRHVKAPILFNLKRSLYELFLVCRILLVVITTYVVIGLVYLFLMRKWHTPELHAFFFQQLRVIFILGIILYEHIRIYYMNKHFESEEWLPIVDENTRVVGRIAKSVSYHSKEKYLHPSVRLYVFHKGRVFLSRRMDVMEDNHREDTPFRRDLFFKEDFNDCIDSLVRQMGLNSDERPKFMCNYVYESDKRRRVLFLYHLNLKDDIFIKSRHIARGKFWTEKEIEHNIGKDVFGHCFEQEFELLKTAIFPVEKFLSSLDD